ncbi:MAG: hypothetical protein HWN66_20570 [Candidatus Helarchaeota archaeon]|nr:hypothetical protein [Candidatus Helarchaeota archaeon]
MTSLLMIGIIQRNLIIQSTLKKDKITEIRMPGVAIPLNHPMSSTQSSASAQFSASAQVSAF